MILAQLIFGESHLSYLFVIERGNASGTITVTGIVALLLVFVILLIVCHCQATAASLVVFECNTHW